MFLQLRLGIYVSAFHVLDFGYEDQENSALQHDPKTDRSEWALFKPGTEGMKPNCI